MLAVTTSNARVGVPTAQVWIFSLTGIPSRGRGHQNQDTACKILQAQIIDMELVARIRRGLIVIKAPRKTLVACALASACGRPAPSDNIASTDPAIRLRGEGVDVAAFERACRNLHEKRLIAHLWRLSFLSASIAWSPRVSRSGYTG